MQDVQFNAMLLAASDRALARRHAEVQVDGDDFETTLGAVTAPPALKLPEKLATTAATPATSGAPDLTGAQMDALMANFGKASTTPAAAVANATPQPKPVAPLYGDAVAALKSAPAAANLTPEQMSALLSGFGRNGGAPLKERAPASPLIAEATGTDMMSATKFFPIQRKAGAPPSLYASADAAMGDAALAPSGDRSFPIQPTGNPVASLYATLPKAATPEPAPAPAPAGPMPPPAVDPASPISSTTVARYYPVGGGHADPGATATARDTYLRAMDVNARMLGLSSHR